MYCKRINEQQFIYEHKLKLDLSVLYSLLSKPYKQRLLVILKATKKNIYVLLIFQRDIYSQMLKPPTLAEEGSFWIGLVRYLLSVT